MQNDNKFVRYYEPIIRLKHWFNFFFIFGLFIAFFELIISPHPFKAKNLQIFPVINIMKFSFLPIELWVGLGAMFSVFIILLKLKKINNYKIGVSPTRIGNILMFIFFFNLILAILIGVLQKNPTALGDMRIHFLFFTTYVILYRNKERVYAYKKVILNLANGLGLIFAVLAINSYFFQQFPVPSFIPKDAYFSSMWFGLYFTVFSAVYYFCNFIFLNKCLLPLLLCLIAIFFRITNKPIIFALVVSLLIASFLIFFIFKIRKRIIFILFSIFLIIFSTLAFENIRLDIYQTFASRYFKIELKKSDLANYSFFDLFGLFKLVIKGKTRDVSAGRFSLWMNYSTLGLKYPIVTPYYGLMPVAPQTGESIAPHNTILRFLYFVGTPAAFSLVALLFLICIKGFKTILVLRNCVTFSKVVQFQLEYVAIYCYIIAIFATEMIGGPILRSLSFCLFFWSFLVILLFESNNGFLSNYYIENLCTRRKSANLQ